MEDLHKLLLDGHKDFTEDELYDLADNATITEEGDNNRWDQDVSSYINIEDRWFCIDWRRAATEYQEHEFDNQPYEVIKGEKTIVIPTWTKK